MAAENNQFIKTEPVISIIIPMYNAADTISRTIESVLNNSYVNWELILIDDGSTDETDKICKSYTDLDKRISYYKKKNSGPGDSRNYGIKKAQGRYYMFLDADDIYHNNTLEVMVNAAIENNVDVLMCGMEVEDALGNINIVSSLAPFNRIIRGKESVNTYLRSLLTDCKHLTPSMANKIYSADFIRRYNVECESWLYHGEDWAFNVKLFSNAIPKIYSINESLYVYLHRKNSISRSYVRPTYQYPFFALKLSLEFNALYELDEQDFIYAKFLQETIEDSISVYMYETEFNPNEMVATFLKHPDFKLLLQKSNNKKIGTGAKIHATAFKYGGYNIGKVLLKLNAFLNRSKNKIHKNRP